MKWDHDYKCVIRVGRSRRMVILYNPANQITESEWNCLSEIQQRNFISEEVDDLIREMNYRDEY